ncbi:MAG: HD domain-containing protein [Planctomycetes bacterium]|nr:HD domain-containing protein [Planctomycetota bacterium]
MSAPLPEGRQPKPPPARHVAVVDCGTSSVRAFLTEIRGAEQRILEDLVYPVDLTPGFTGGKLDRAAMDGVVQAFTGIRSAAESYGIVDIRAVATSAMREAANSDVLIESLRQKARIEVEIIDGSEAARLYFEALRVLLARCGKRLSGNTLMIDVGGGSTCVSLIRQGKLVHSVDEHYGTIRLYEQFRELKDSTDFAVTIDRYALGAAHMLLGRLPEGSVKHLVVTGGEVRRLVTLLTPQSLGLLESLDPVVVTQWFERMQPMTPQQRADACGTDLFGAARLLPAATLIRHLCAISGADRVLVPQLTLRDGLLADLLPGAHGPHYLDSQHLLAEARQLVTRYGGNHDYADNTASLAVQIFDQTRNLHGLGERDRTLLEFSALVHDIGAYINVRERHKHSMYIILAADIAGLTGDEQRIVAHIARYHRRSAPQAHHRDFQALHRRSRVLVSYLASILRLAYGLDVERTQRIKKIRCEVSRDHLLLHVDRRQVALERWSIDGKKGMFVETFGLNVKVIPREGE